MEYTTISINTHGEKFYDISAQISETLTQNFPPNSSGVLHLFIMHTSCALIISESFDPSAAHDMEQFLKKAVPRNLPYLTHTTEGPDDSPSHIKSIFLQQSLSIIVEKSAMILGTWQGVYLCEFRDAAQKRQVLLKFMADR